MAVSCDFDTDEASELSSNVVIARRVSLAMLTVQGKMLDILMEFAQITSTASSSLPLFWWTATSVHELMLFRETRSTSSTPMTNAAREEVVSQNEHDV